jgi:hypothetical protein
VRTGFRLVLIALALFVTAMGLANVMDDDTSRRDEAMKWGCPANAHECSLSGERTPFGETFLITARGTSKTYACRRAAIFVGAWHCGPE